MQPAFVTVPQEDRGWGVGVGRQAGNPLTGHSQTRRAPRAAQPHPWGSLGGRACSELWRPRVSPRRPQILQQPLRHRVGITTQSAYKAARNAQWKNG